MTPRSTHDETVTRMLRALAQAEAGLETPRHVENTVMAGWDAAHAPQRRSRTRTAVRGAAAVAAGIIAIGAFTLQHSSAPLPPRLPAAPRVSWASGNGAPAIVPEPVVVHLAAPVAPAEPLVMLLGEPLTEGEPVRVVRMRVAGSTLAALGIRSVGPQPPASVDLDVLVTEDGVARALRVGL